jgi:hypothetical protein
VIEFALDACKYYERGRNKNPLYVTTLFNMQAIDHYMHWGNQKVDAFIHI